MNTTRAIAREDANLNTFLEHPRERWLESCFVAEGPLYYAVLALHITPPSKWKTVRVKILQRLLLTAHARAVSHFSLYIIEIEVTPRERMFSWAD